MRNPLTIFPEVAVALGIPVAACASQPYPATRGTPQGGGNPVRIHLRQFGELRPILIDPALHTETMIIGFRLRPRHLRVNLRSGCGLVALGISLDYARIARLIREFRQESGLSFIFVASCRMMLRIAGCCAATPSISRIVSSKVIPFQLILSKIASNAHESKI